MTTQEKRKAFEDTRKWLVFHRGNGIWTVTPPMGIDVESYERDFYSFHNAWKYADKMSLEVVND